MKVTDRDLWWGVGGGVAAVVAWFVATRTTLVLAYGPGGASTLQQVQALCDSSIGQFGRLLSAQAAARCGSVDTYTTWLNVLGVAGVFLAAVCGVILAGRRRTGSAARQRLL